MVTTLWKSSKFDELDETSKEYCMKYMETIVGIDDLPPIQYPKLSIPQYGSLIRHIFQLDKVNSEFWHYVVKIAWVMIAIEKDPQLLAELNTEEQLDAFRRDIIGE